MPALGAENEDVLLLRYVVHLVGKYASAGGQKRAVQPACPHLGLWLSAHPLEGTHDAVMPYRRKSVAFEGNTDEILISCSSQSWRLEVRLVIPVEWSYVRRSWLMGWILIDPMSLAKDAEGAAKDGECVAPGTT